MEVETVLKVSALSVSMTHPTVQEYQSGMAGSWYHRACSRSNKNYNSLLSDTVNKHNIINQMEKVRTHSNAVLLATSSTRRSVAEGIFPCKIAL